MVFIREIKIEYLINWINMVLYTHFEWFAVFWRHESHTLFSDGLPYYLFQEDKINALIKAAGVNVEPFWPGLFAKVR